MVNHATGPVDWEATAQMWKERAAGAENRIRILRDGSARLQALLTRQSVEIHQISKERDTLRAQLDAMTTEWGVVLPGGKLVGEAKDMADAQRIITYWPEHPYRPGRRLVGPWVEVEEGK